MPTSTSVPPVVGTDPGPSAGPPERARVRCPPVLQMEAVECGAAALSIVLGHFGRFEPLEGLREAVGVSRDGSNARDILRAGRSHGLTARAFRRTPTSIRTLPLPSILFWQMNHFLVLEGWKPGTWYLNDPASGPRQVDDQEFDRSFSGVVLQFEPGPEFRPGGRRPAVWNALLRRLRPARAAVVFVILAGLGLLVPGLAVPALSRAFVDGFLVAGRGEYLPVILGGLAAAAVLQILLSWLQQSAVHGLRTVLTTGIFAGQTQRILRLSMRFFTQRAASDVAYRAGLGASVAGLLSGPLITVLLTSAVAIVYLAIIFTLSWSLGLIVLAAAMTVLVLLRLSASRQRDLANLQMREQLDTVVLQAGAVNLIESIKAQGGEEQSIAAISAARSRLLSVRQRQDVAMLPLHAVPAALTSVATLALLSVGALSVMAGSLSLGALLAIQVLTGSVLAPVGLLAGLGSQINQLSATVTRLEDVDKAAVDPEIAADLARRAHGQALAGSVQPLRGELTLRDLTFGYAPQGPPLIEGFSLHLRPGARVALVGASGSGKSTVARLVVGLEQPSAGVVLLDGRPRADFDRRVLGDGIAFVDQDRSLFEATIRDNLTLWDETVDDEHLVRAARDACLEEVILARPGGYDSTVGEGGRGLSGGQQQRMEIARALVRDPAVIVLDEATSALDAVTERTIDLALRRRNCTCLIVAHRLSTVRDADEIIVMDRGTIAERGTHDELVALDGLYARLVLA